MDASVGRVAGRRAPQPGRAARPSEASRPREGRQTDTPTRTRAVVGRLPGHGRLGPRQLPPQQGGEGAPPGPPTVRPPAAPPLPSGPPAAPFAARPGPERHSSRGRIDLAKARPCLRRRPCRHRRGGGARARSTAWIELGGGLRGRVVRKLRKADHIPPLHLQRAGAGGGCCLFPPHYCPRSCPRPPTLQETRKGPRFPHHTGNREALPPAASPLGSQLRRLTCSGTPSQHRGPPLSETPNRASLADHCMITDFRLRRQVRFLRERGHWHLGHPPRTDAAAGDGGPASEAGEAGYPDARGACP